jgi:hypothetical protein
MYSGFVILMHVPDYNTCQHTTECMSTYIRNFNIHVKKKYMSTYKKMYVNIHKNDVEHLTDIFQGLPDAHTTVKYLTPKSKEYIIRTNSAFGDFQWKSPFDT